MASHVPKPSQKSVEEMMKDLKVNPRAKVNSSGTDPAKERSKSNTTCCVPSAGDVTGSVVKGDVVNESLETYQGLPCPFGGYYGYYFPGYDGYVGELNDQVLYSNGLELQDTVMQRENGSFVYYMPGVHPFYDPNNAYVPQNSVGIDGQFVNQQYTQVFAYPAYFPNAPGYGDPISLPYMWDSSVSLRDGWHEGVYNVGSEFSGPNPSMSSSRHVSVRHTNQTPSLSSTNNVPGGPGTGYQSKALSKLGLQGKGHSPNQTSSYNQEKGMKDVKVKTTPDNTVKDSATFNEKNLGSRISNGQDPISNVNDAAELVSVDVNVNKNREASVVRRDLYNLSDFQTKYDQASFFVIKSYSEDDIHKSIKYGVWSSTLNGNKKLDNAYKEAQKKIAEKGGKCPVFLFFSVNASGQFCGVAEMIGNVNYEKSMDFWQQDKWTGYFPVKWHIVKDVPNPQLRHIILENNENKPVTNSRDTQEVRLPQGLQILNIFKNYASKTSILDDFEFYESREKVMQQKRIRSRMTYFDRTKITENQTVAMQPMGISAAKITQPENDKKIKE